MVPPDFLSGIVIFQFRHYVLLTPVLVLTERITIPLRKSGGTIRLEII